MSKEYFICKRGELGDLLVLTGSIGTITVYKDVWENIKYIKNVEEVVLLNHEYAIDAVNHREGSEAYLASNFKRIQLNEVNSKTKTFKREDVQRFRKRLSDLEEQVNKLIQRVSELEANQS